MRTGLKIFGGTAAFFAFTLFSCSSETVETEMDRWCECETDLKKNPSRAAECAKMIDDISRKYEFDPQAVVKIRTKVLECKQ